ncbi:MAG: hypothetical protein HYZ93_06625 [Candidatus Omnitrophica bacterium]|nr:hypothetical protein [Candidatus Omnitrophota bacterium]
MKRKTRILQLARSDEAREIDFELDFLRSLTIAQRFRLMKKKTQELLQLLEQSGHRRPPQVIQRS